MGITDKAADILDASFQLTESGVEFFTDILWEFTGDNDDYDGAAGTIWGSWNDNILGEGGVVDSAIGPEGIGGEIIEAIPEVIRKSTGPIFNQAFDVIDTVYEMGVDRPLAALVTLANAGLNDGLILNYLDPTLWQEVNKIVGIGEQEGGGRSTGQAIALMASSVNILDPEAVARVEGTAMYKMSSGLIDGAMQWYLDPTNIAGKMVKGAKAKKVANIRTQVASGNYKLLLETDGYGRFKSAVSEAGKDLNFSEKFRQGKGYTKGDEALIAEYAVLLQKAAAEGKLGRGFLDMSYDNARTYAALAGGLDLGRTDQAFDYMIRIQLGDMNAIKDMETLATSYVNNILDNGLYDELDVVNKELRKLDELESTIAYGDRVDDVIFDPNVGVIDSGTKSLDLDKAPKSVRETLEANPELINPDEITLRRNQIRKELNERQRVLEDELFVGEYATMPFAAALIVKEERLRTMAQQYGGRSGHYGIDAANDYLNSSGDLVTAAANEILVSHNVNLLDPLPSIGGMNAAGIATKTYLTNSKFGQSVAANKAVRLIVEKTPHQVMNWDDPAQQYATFDRMLRDAGNVNYEGMSLLESVGLVSENVLGQFMELQTRAAKKEYFDGIVSRLNNGLPELFNKQLSEFELNNMSRTLQRQYGKAQELLKEKSKAARSKTYGNRDYTRVDYADAGEIISQYIPLTPAQLAESSLVPRYDLYQQAFGTDPGVAKRVLGEASYRVGRVTNEFTNLWKKAVLIRPAWPLRVLIDEVARTGATIGAQNTIKGLMAGYNDLRVAYFRKSGVDIGQPIFDRLLRELYDDAKKNVGWEKWENFAKDPWELVPTDYAEILETYNAAVLKQADMVNPAKKLPSMEELVTDVITQEYGKARINKRTSMATGLGLFVAGPVGAAGMAGIYSLYARNSLKRVARSEINNNQMFVLRNSADQLLVKEIGDIRKQIDDLAPDDVVNADKLIQEIKDLETAAELLKAQAKNLDDHQKMILDNVKEKNATLYNNFDKAGQLAAESRYNNLYIGDYNINNAFGGTATDVAIHKSAISSDNSNRQIWEGATLAQRKASQQVRREQMDLLGPTPVTQKQFNLGWNDTVNRQWIPAATGGPFQEFMEMFWNGSTDQEIFTFLQNKGSVVRDAYPAHFQGKDLADFIEVIRTESQSIIPNLPEFNKVRERAASGTEISWERDIMEVVERSFDGDIAKVRELTGNTDFGRVVADSQFTDMVNTKVMQVKIRDHVDSIFESLGTMPTDALTRSTVFRTVYETEITRQLSGFKGKGKSKDAFNLSNKDLKIIENRARQKATADTKNLLYDLAERSRFEEVAANLMPFYGAWQEVVTRWTGIGIDNPYLVGQTIRNWRLLEAEDENGQRFAVIRLPKIGFIDPDQDLPSYMDWIPFSGGKLFGSASEFNMLDGQALDFNLKSASMIGGTPGFGPMLTYPLGEMVIANPNLEKTMKFVFPYGVSEGSTALKRWINSVSPAFGKAAAGGILGLTTPERAKTLLRITGDLAAEYHASGDVISTEADMQVFEEEVERRTNVILQIRTVGTLVSPLSFRVQSPHYKLIDEYHQISKDKGLEAADTWLLHNHEDLWAITGRQTAAAGVASGTLQGEATYERHQEFLNQFPEIQDVVLGRVGARDVQFEYSQAVAIKEMSEGRRKTMTPRDFFTAAQMNRGWYQWGKITDVVNDQLQNYKERGMSIDVQNYPDLVAFRTEEAIKIGRENRTWWEEWSETSSPATQAKVMEGFRSMVSDPTFDYKPEWPFIQQYVNGHDEIAMSMEIRAEQSGNSEFLKLGHSGNSDLKTKWLNLRLRLRSRPDFVAIFDRYFAKMETVTRSNFPSQFPRKVKV